MTTMRNSTVAARTYAVRKVTGGIGAALLAATMFVGGCARSAGNDGVVGTWKFDEQTVISTADESQTRIADPKVSKDERQRAIRQMMRAQALRFSPDGHFTWNGPSGTTPMHGIWRREGNSINCEFDMGMNTADLVSMRRLTFTIHDGKLSPDAARGLMPDNYYYVRVNDDPKAQ